ncbi:MAG: DUF4139 domain-containing protein [Synergistaceae bacterium]|nr:DUF4139 domain-containing protein [Synergistaceae bacterium]
MKAFILCLVIVSLLVLAQSPSLALEAPGNFTVRITAVDFFPSGARFTFTAEPEDSGGNFTVLLPGAFRADSVRLLNPGNVYGDIHIAGYSRTKWTPPQLEALRLQSEEQSALVSSLNTRKSALEQTLSLLKNSAPDKSNPEALLSYIQQAQELRLETENELSLLRVRISQEQDKMRVLNQELQNRTPAGSMSFTEITGRAKGTVYFEAFTPSASWRPGYTLNLDTVTGKIEAAMYITASQKTGLPFTGKMTFHTKTPDERITFPEISPLQVGIKPKEQVIASMSTMRIARNNRQFKSARMAEEADMYMAEPEMADEEEAPKAPAVNETLADRTITAEGTITGDGIEKVFEASAEKFTLSGNVELILIPEQRENAWIIASMDEGNEHLIPGEADLRVDGHSSGKIYLDEYGKGQRRIPFGYADQITAKKERLIGVTGVQWFSGVFTSGYKIDITNGTKYPQTVTVRDRLPVPTDEKIKLEVKRIEPKEKERDKENRLTWEIEIPAGETVPVIVDYTLSYPSGEELQYK